MSFFLIECDGQISGRRHTWFAERDTDRAGFSNTVDDIMGGQVEDVRRVIEVNMELCHAADASEEVALEILHRIVNECGDLPTGNLRNFIELHAADALAELESERANARPDRAEHCTYIGAP